MMMMMTLFRWAPVFKDGTVYSPFSTLHTAVCILLTATDAQPVLVDSYTVGTGSFPGIKRPGRGVDHPLHLAPRSKKE